MIWIVYGAIILATAGALFFASRRRTTDVAPTRYDPPVKIERNDFPDSGADTLVIVFTSRVCDSCVSVSSKANALRSDSVNVNVVEYEDSHGKKLHAKYQIEAVPTMVICDENGVVSNAYVGPVTATDLWADVARVRGASIDDCSNH